TGMEPFTILGCDADFIIIESGRLEFADGPLRFGLRMKDAHHRFAIGIHCRCISRSHCIAPLSEWSDRKNRINIRRQDNLPAAIMPKVWVGREDFLAFSSLSTTASLSGCSAANGHAPASAAAA